MNELARGFLTHGTDFIAELAVVVLVALLTGLDVVSLPGGGEIRIRRAMLVLISLAALYIFSNILWDYFARRLLDVKIGRADPSRISVVIPDIEGGEGTKIEDALEGILRQKLGTGVQIIEVPRWHERARYGDTASLSREESSKSASCAKHYNGDIVLWGEYDKASDSLFMSYTGKSDICPLSPCGNLHLGPIQVSLDAKSPKYSTMSDVLAQSPKIYFSTLLSYSLDSKGNVIEKGPLINPSECLSSINNLNSAIKKVDNLLDGLPENPDKELLSNSTAVSSELHLQRALKLNNLKEIDDTIGRIEVTANKLNDPYNDKMSLPMVQALMFRFSRTEGQQQKRELATKVASYVGRNLPVPDVWPYENAGQVYLSLYLDYHKQGDLVTAARYLEEEIHRRGVNKFHVYTSLANLYAERASFTGNYSYYSIMNSWLQQATDEFEPLFYFGLSLEDLDIQDRCQYARLEMLRYRSENRTDKRNAIRHYIEVLPWTDVDLSEPVCLEALKSFSSSLNE